MSTNIKTTIKRSWNIFAHGAYIPNDYFVFNDMEMVYISIPKVACTAIKHALMGGLVDDSLHSDNVMDIHTLTAKYRKSSLTMKDKKFYKFAFVRNPFERLVSCYKDKVQREIQHNNRYYFDTGYNQVLIKNLFGSQFNSSMSFADFVKLVCKIPDFLSDGHFKSQYSMLYKHGNLVPDFVGKLENMEKDWEIIANRCHCGKLKTVNRTDNEDWMSCYTSENLVESVAARYKKDIDCFGYRDIYDKLIDAYPHRAGK